LDCIFLKKNINKPLNSILTIYRRGTYNYRGDSINDFSIRIIYMQVKEIEDRIIKELDGKVLKEKVINRRTRRSVRIEMRKERHGKVEAELIIAEPRKPFIKVNVEYLNENGQVIKKEEDKV